MVGKGVLSGAGKGIAVKAVGGLLALGCVGTVAAVAGPSLVSAATGTASATTAAADRTSSTTAAAAAAASRSAAEQSAAESAVSTAALQPQRTLSQPGLQSHRPVPDSAPVARPTPTALAAPVGVDVGLIDEGCRPSGNSAAPYHLTFTAVFSDGHHMPGLAVDSTSSSVDEVYVSYGGRSMFQVASGADFTC